MTEPIVNFDVLTTVFELCGLKDRRNMRLVSKAFKEGYEGSRVECSIRDMSRVRRLFLNHKHGATKVFRAMGNKSMTVETIYVRGGGELSYCLWNPRDYTYDLLTYPVGVDGRIIHSRWKSGSVTVRRTTTCSLQIIVESPRILETPQVTSE